MIPILLTGGSGFIGSHTAIVLLQAGYRVVVLDNLANASREALRRVEAITGRDITFVQADVRETAAVEQTLRAEHIQAVVHFAGLKAVGESTQNPIAYYENNVTGTLSLCRAMSAAGVKNLVFSSSATVYAESTDMPLPESAPTGRPTNPYGTSKLVIEWLLRDLHTAEPDWSIALLRYFNPGGAHESGTIGEDPNGMPNNLLPFITQVAVGRIPELAVFGDDYPTPDGSGVRDYIHVMDLAAGHLAALRVITDTGGLRTWNLGVGRGYSVLEVISAFQQVTGIDVPYRIAPRRSGDLAQCWADVSRARDELGWQAERGLTDILTDAWRWQRHNPQGFPK